MNIFKNALILIGMAAILASCATGKNAFDKGNYQTAIDRAVNRLQANPNNKKAKEVLLDGYRVASNYHNKRIQQFKRSNDTYKWEKVFNEYAVLNSYYRDIQRCPACMDLVTPTAYLIEQETAAQQAALVQMELGKESLSMNTIETGRQAYRHFQNALKFSSNLPKVDSLMEEARYMGTLRVQIEPIPIHSRNLELTNEYFENRMFEYFNNYSQSMFLEFFTPDEADQYDIQPDQIISMEFDDFVLGQARIESKTVEVSRDSVVVGTFTDKEEVTHDVYGTVKAEFTRHKKTLASSGVLNFEIKDAYSNSTIVHRKLASEDVWVHEWANYNGDKRALTKKEIALSKEKELPPPSAQVLFSSFIDRIYSQVIEQVQRSYRNSSY